jgi:Cohesin domain
MFNLPAAQLLLASLVAGIIGISGFLFGTTVIQAPVSIILEPTNSTRVVGETFVTTLVVKSSIPVNVFQGLLEFDPEKLTVNSIDYNTSVADLWAEEPWYSNGDGTINFTGGTTIPGGFVGEGTLITVTFTAKNTGEATVRLAEMKVLQHDGKGTEAAVTAPIESVFAVEPAQLSKETLFEAAVEGPTVIVIPETKNRDLNQDGKQSMADVSIFMTDLISKNLRSDLNGDGTVDLKDLSILTN